MKDCREFGSWMTHWLTRVPLGTQHCNGGGRRGWWWKMDVCAGRIPQAVSLSDRGDQPGSDSRFNRTTKTFGQKAEKLTANQKLRFLYPLPSGFYVFIDGKKHQNAARLNPKICDSWQIEPQMISQPELYQQSSVLDQHENHRGQDLSQQLTFL